MTQTLTAADLRPGDQVCFADANGHTWPTVLRVVNDGTRVEVLLGDAQSSVYRTLAADRALIVRRAA